MKTFETQGFQTTNYSTVGIRGHMFKFSLVYFSDGGLKVELAGIIDISVSFRGLYKLCIYPLISGKLVQRLGVALTESRKQLCEDLGRFVVGFHLNVKLGAFAHFSVGQRFCVGFSGDDLEAKSLQVVACEECMPLGQGAFLFNFDRTEDYFASIVLNGDTPLALLGRVLWRLFHHVG